MALLKVVASDSRLKRPKKLCQKYKYTVLDKTTKSLEEIIKNTEAGSKIQ